ARSPQSRSGSRDEPSESFTMTDPRITDLEADRDRVVSWVPTMRPKQLEQAAKLRDVVYEIRGPANTEDDRLEREGHQILKLNIGNPAAFGFQAPDAIIRDMIAALPESAGYSESRGVMPARRAVASHYEVKPGFPEIDLDRIYLGNGVSELIIMTMQALLDDGDEV